MYPKMGGTQKSRCSERQMKKEGLFLIKMETQGHMHNDPITEMSGVGRCRQVAVGRSLTGAVAKNYSDPQ